jgi:acetolactate synthase-1/2/3 large subunit
MLYIMLHGRKGPIWLDVPLDVQATSIPIDQLEGFDPADLSKAELDVVPTIKEKTIQDVVKMLSTSIRPVLLLGNGIHASGAEQDLELLIKTLQIPTLTTWIAADLLEHENPLYFGRPGTAASRGANFAIQNSDFLLAIGCRMDFSITGFDRTQFARDAKIIVVDIDLPELAKLGNLPDLTIQGDAGDFIRKLNSEVSEKNIVFKDQSKWISQCTVWKEKYPVVLPEYRNQQGFVNTYVFTEVLCEELAEGDIIIPGSSGASLDTFWLSAKLKKGQRSLPTGGLGAMGYGLPAAIGGCIGAGKKRTISVDGDGGFVMNIQELEVAKRLNLPIKYFVLNNNGYASIRSSQGGYFKEIIGCDPSSGLTLPSIRKLASAFEIPFIFVGEQSNLRGLIRQTLDTPGVVICEIMVQPDQAIGPRASSKIKSDGTMRSTPLEDLFPFLEREELKSNMLIPLIEDKDD